MSGNVNNNISNNVLPNGTNSDTQNDAYDKIDTPPQPSTANTQTHLDVLKGLASVTDIQNYIGQNVIAPLKSETPPNLSGVDRALVDLIATSANVNPQLSAVLYHTIKDNLGYKLNIENQTETGQRKIILNGSGKNITDSHYTQLAKADSDLNAYHNDYFETLGVAPTPKVPITPASTATVPATQTPTTSAPTTVTPTPSTDVSDEGVFDDTEQETQIMPNFSEKFLNLLPVDADLSDFDELLIIDTKTGDEVNPKKYNLDDPEEAKEFEDLMARSIIMQTNGKSEAITDDMNMQKIADALVEYITKPYETKISPDGLEEILDNFSLEASSEIFNIVQEQIIKSGNPAHIMKLKNYKNKHSDNGLDGIIGEIYNFNYLGGNNGNPLLFLSDIFANDTTYKLQSTNIDKIATVLGEHTKEYLSSLDSDDPEDIRKNQSSLAFISQTIELLSNSNPENQSQGNIDKLLQAVMAKSGDNIAVKDILTDLAANAGIETFKTVSIQTGQSLMSNFGEFTYTDANGNAKTFSSTETTGNFENFKTDITALLNGTHPSITASIDPNNPQGDLESKSMTASQAADAIAMLSLAQQTAIIAELTDEDIVDLETFASMLPEANENLNNLIHKVKFKDIVTDIKEAKTPTEKADIFAEAIEGFTDKTSQAEMTNLITQIVGTDIDFLDLKTSEFVEFKTLLETNLTDIEGIDIPIVIKNLETSLNAKNIRFQSEIDGGQEHSATSVANATDSYLEILETGELTNEQVDTFLKGLSAQDKADPDFWDDVLADRVFESADEYNKFVYSITRIMNKIDEKSTEAGFDTLKTNLTNALSEHKPTFTYEPKPTTDKDGNTTYADHLMYYNDDNIKKPAKSFLGTPTLLSALTMFDGDITKATEELGKTIDTTTSKEDLALYATTLVEYIAQTYPNDTPEQKSEKLITEMDKIAEKLDRGHQRDKKINANDGSQLLDFIQIMAKTVHDNGQFNTGQIGDHIYNDTHLETHIYADRIHGRGKKQRDDRHVFLRDSFNNIASGTEAYTMPTVTPSTTDTPTPAPEPTDTTTEE